MSSVRRRPNSCTASDDTDSPLTMGIPVHNRGLTLQSMEAGSPQHKGKVMKLHVPPLYPILPKFLQTWLLRCAFFRWTQPVWKSRYLILLGSYLYKLKDDRSPGQNPKGSPIPIDDVRAQIVEDDSTDPTLVGLRQLLPVGYTSVIRITTLRKIQYYACGSRTDALEWVDVLRQARQEQMTRSMGHAPDGSYPPLWSHFDCLGRNLAERKDRIRNRMAQNNHMEMTNMVAGGPSQQGFFS